MKTFLFIIACGSLTLLSISVEAQNIEGQPIASQYGAFQLQGTATNSFVFAPAACQVTAGGVNFSALTQGVRVRVVDPGNRSLDETVTAGLVNINACSVQLAVSNTHVPPFYVTSGTAGLQEAINANSKGGPANTVVLDASWYALGGSSSIITSVRGSTSLGLVDITTTPYTWYSWNGSAYAQVAIGGGCSGGCVTALNGISGGMALTPGPNITVAPSGQNIEISAASGVPSVNGVTAATTIAPGANITVSTSGNTITVAAAGGAGTGAVGSGNQYQDATYPNSGSTATVGALTNKYTVPTGLSTSQLNTLFSSLSTGDVAIQNGDSITPFSNPNFVGVQDLRETFPVKPWNVKESGAQCDLTGAFGSTTQGSSTVTATSGRFFNAADVGKNLEFVGTDPSTGLKERWDPVVTSFISTTQVSVSPSVAPFTVSSYSMQIGHRDDAAIAAAFGQFSFTRPIEFPVGNCWSDTIAVFGQSFHGISSTRSQVTGVAGKDVFSGLDPSEGGFQSMSPGMQVHDLAINFDPRINATQPWEDMNAAGTLTTHAATYRPAGIFTVWANYPLGPGWIEGPGVHNTGAINGVAVTTQNSAVICIPTSETEPPVGQKIIFPYFATIFTSTISSLTGSGCASGSNPLTMAAAFPNTSAYTTTQSEWMAGTSVQTLQTTIPSTYSFAPTVMTITATSKTGTVGTYTFTLTSGNAPVVGQFTTITGTTNGGGVFNGANNIATVSGTTSGTFTIDGFASGTVASASEDGSANAVAVPLVITLANPITPPLTTNVASTGSNVAPYGLVQIDGEQFSYFGNSDYPATANSTPTITLTGRAQNGTTAVSHSIGATIVPLNPFQPTWPWPVTPSLNTNATMPANASYFPAWNIGVAGFSQPWFNGASGAAGYGLSFTNFHDLVIQINPNSSGTGNPDEAFNGFQVQNATTGIYITALPFNATFKDIQIINPQYGIFLTMPSINTFGVFEAFPTANGTNWENIRIQSAAYDFFSVGGQNDSKKDFQTFCQNFGETGTSWPGLAPGNFGCGAAWMWGGIYDDLSGGGGSDNNFATLDNWYIEAEDGSQTGLQPGYEFNCGTCSYNNIQPSGLVTFIDGGNNNFTNSRFNAIDALPIVNYGGNTIMSEIQGVGNSFPLNIYGGSSLINYGPNASINGQIFGNNGPFTNLANGNNISRVTGQTGEAFETGNDATAYVSSSSAIIYPDQFNTNHDVEAAPMSVGWTFDDMAPISHSYTACNTNTSGIGCNTHSFNGNGGAVGVGPGQRLAPGEYIAHWAMRNTGGADTLNFQLSTTDVGTSCTPVAILDQNIALSNTWTQYTSAPFSLAGSTNCGLDVWFNGTTAGADQVQLAYLIFTPVWHNVILPVNTPADNATCTPGAFLGSDSSFLYICTASGMVKRAALSTY